MQRLHATPYSHFNDLVSDSEIEIEGGRGRSRNLKKGGGGSSGIFFKKKRGGGGSNHLPGAICIANKTKSSQKGGGGGGGGGGGSGPPGHPRWICPWEAGGAAIHCRLRAIDCSESACSASLASL